MTVLDLYRHSKEKIKMSRTYRHTNGANKRVKGKIRDFMYSLDKDRTKDIDYNDYLSHEDALTIRQGKYEFGVPKYFRKMLHCQTKSEVKEFLYKVKYNQQDIDGMYYPYSRNNARFLYF